MLLVLLKRVIEGVVDGVVSAMSEIAEARRKKGRMASRSIIALLRLMRFEDVDALKLKVSLLIQFSNENKVLDEY